MQTNAILLLQKQRGPRPRFPSCSLDEDAGRFRQSIHQIDHDAAGAPTIAAGTPLDTSTLAALVAGARPRRRAPNSPRDGARCASRSARFVGAHAGAASIFQPVGPAGGPSCAFAGRTSCPGRISRARPCRHWRRLCVYALGRSERPRPRPSRFTSPVLNVFPNGSLCWGNIPRPTSLEVAAIPEFERALLDPGRRTPIRQELTVTGKGGLARLLDNLAATRATRFPVKRLKAFAGDRRQAVPRGGTKAEPMTLGD